MSFDCRIIHEIEFDITHTPLIDQCAVGLAQIFLGCRIGCIEHIEGIEAVKDMADMNWFSLAVVNQPVFVFFIDPCPLRNFKRGCPDP